ncbi:MAG TPA: aminopeptidase [Solirubrobacteraceae bacterium]|nr:aminopeptidase [Solirubrobacteraceae bacterium]
MIDPDAFAVLIAEWCLGVEPGQQILIRTTTLAQEAAVALHRAVLERGGFPLLRLEPPGLEADFFRHAREGQLDHVAPIELHEASAADASVRIMAPASINPLAAVDPAALARRARALTPWREAQSARRWALTLWPTAALAQQAGMPEPEYADFVQRALFLDQPDPVAAWVRLREEQGRVIERLAPAREVRIESAGTDLRLNVEGRTWINSDGRRNMPSGEVFTGPHEHSANGHIHFDVPSSARGVEVAGVDLTFRDGEVVAARAHVGDPHLQAALATDPGARCLGELGIGTNTGIDRATGSTLLDEKMAGTVHLALGRSYPETGGVNQSAVHWDLICDLRSGGRVSVDGETLIEDGRFVWG